MMVNSIHKEIGYSMQRSDELFESVMEIMKSTLESGEDVLISGFGKFCVNEKNERKGRNPQTGESITLAPRKVVTFKYSSNLKDSVNNK
ncbi:MAG: integration host factor subunit alpha [Deltaproteobacteria bacterium]|nr:integration host factor subunit alpha [Deltaproteobacteria bacterium]